LSDDVLFGVLPAIPVLHFVHNICTVKVPENSAFLNRARRRHGGGTTDHKITDLAALLVLAEGRTLTSGALSKMAR
jgi:hypothetical protein